MAKFLQGVYTVRNTQKYAGNGSPRYRSGWELAMMNFLDSNDNIIQWASESIAIQYRNPLTGKISNYIPDFLIQYRDRNNTVITELVEIKPKKQSIVESKASQRDRMIVAVNMAKWDAASKWCKRAGIKFRVVTEDQIFHQGGSRRK